MTRSLSTRSGRIELRAPTEQDDAAVAALRSHPYTRRHIPAFPETFTVEDAKALRLKRDADLSHIPFYIFRTDTNEFIGATSIAYLDRDERACDTGILLREEYARAGYATDTMHAVLKHAFEEEGMHRVSYHTSEKNVGMRGWLDMAGATLDGILREAWPDKDGYTSVCVYSILEQEWASVVKQRLEERIDKRGCLDG
uniref:Ribosomal-protein-alanine acetyltransferase n=1 Tax=Mycena chlorophos TaxID=658473 RepID=A0ABQ0LZI3_MYCCL|nr:ribosomal-protein-alanine acetyltransferase [Mycena chlorophos]